MTTFIINEPFPKEAFKIVKKPIQRGDRVIFQHPDEPEAEIIVTQVVDQPGMMKGWKVITWNNES